MSTSLQVESETPQQSLERFIVQEGGGRIAATVERYRGTIDRLQEYLAAIDPDELAGSADAETWRQAKDAGVDFLSAVGFGPMIHVLPPFLAEPWLPGAGIERAGHRSLVERLLTFLRREGLIDAERLRADCRAVRRAVAEARGLDHGRGPFPDPWPVSSDSEDSWAARTTAGTPVQLVVSLPVEIVEDILNEMVISPNVDVSGVVAGALRRDRAHRRPSASMQAWGR